MNWADERYVRLYTRNTVEWEMLPWQARALFPLLLRACDRAGILRVGKHGVAGLAHAVKLPLEVVEVGVAGLLEDGCVVVPDPGTYVVPNFMDAQEASQSDAHRAREYRCRARDAALAGTVTKRDAGITKRDATVTPRHTPSQPVTARHSVPSVPSRADQDHAHPAGERATEPAGPPGDGEADEEPAAPPTPPERPRFDLDALYAGYPRKEGKARGMAKAQSLIRTDVDYQRHRRAIANLVARIERDGTERQFVPHFSTWMNGTWLDYVDGLPDSTRSTPKNAAPEPAHRADVLRPLSEVLDAIPGGSS